MDKPELTEVKMNPKSLSVIVILVTAFVFIAPAHAQEEGEAWGFTIVPHLWITAVGGDVNINDERIQLGEFVEEHDFALLAYAEARYGKFGMFFRPSSARTTATGVGESNLKAWIFELAGVYRFLGDGSPKTTSVDFFAGVRRWEEARGWTDPMLGLRVRFTLAEELSFHARGDVGGFNIAENTSDLSWNLTTDIAYQIAPAISLWAGYHILHTEFNDDSADGGFSLNGTIHGPAIGAGFHFGNAPPN